MPNQSYFSLQTNLKLIESIVSKNIDQKFIEFEKNICDKIEDNNNSNKIVSTKISEFNSTLQFICQLITDAIKKINEKIEKDNENFNKIELNSHISTHQYEATIRFKKMIEASYYLYEAMRQSKIQINSMETVFLEKAFAEFTIALEDLLTHEKLGITVNSEKNGKK